MRIDMLSFVGVLLMLSAGAQAQSHRDPLTPAAPTTSVSPLSSDGLLLGNVAAQLSAASSSLPEETAIRANFTDSLGQSKPLSAAEPVVADFVSSARTGLGIAHDGYRGSQTTVPAPPPALTTAPRGRPWLHALLGVVFAVLCVASYWSMFSAFGEVFSFGNDSINEIKPFEQ